MQDRLELTTPRPGAPKKVGEEEIAPAMTSGYLTLSQAASCPPAHNTEWHWMLPDKFVCSWDNILLYPLHQFCVSRLKETLNMLCSQNKVCAAQHTV